MPSVSRRQFLEESMIVAGLAAAAASPTAVLAEDVAPAKSANETIRHAVIGCRIRGRVHAKEFGS